MGKFKGNKKTWGPQKRRKQIERLLDDREIYTEEELKARKRLIAIICKRNDQRLKQEQESIKDLGYCTHCYSVLTTTGVCMSNCK